MRTVLLTVHGIVVVVVTGLCAWESLCAIELYGHEYLALTYRRSLIALLCGGYSVAQLVLLIKRRLTNQALLFYYPLSLALGLTASFVAGGYGKGWAPADAAEALQATVVGLGIVGLLSLAAAFSCYRALCSRRIMPNPSINTDASDNAAGAGYVKR